MDCENQPTADKTWANCNADFTVTYKNHNVYICMIGNDPSYHSANSMNQKLVKQVKQYVRVAAVQAQEQTEQSNNMV